MIVSVTFMTLFQRSTVLKGVILRDSHGVAQVKLVTGNKILRILKSKGIVISIESVNPLSVCTLVLGLAPDLPEDLYYLIKKAVAIRKHLEKHRKVRIYILSLSATVLWVWSWL